MNGATALPPPKTMSKPNNSNTIMIGANQKILRSFTKSQRSFKKSIMYYLFKYEIINSDSNLLPSSLR